MLARRARDPAGTLPFAAIVQSAMLVHNKALQQPTHDRYVLALLDSIFVTDPDSVRDVYPDPDALKLGIDSAQAILARPDADLVPVLKYTLTLIEIAARLTRSDALVETLSSGIAELSLLQDSLERPTLQARLSALYQATASRLSVRVQVKGSPTALQQPNVADAIRALLLAGVRAAWLWRQLGGRRWHLILRRSNMRQSLAELQAQLTPI